MQWVWRRQGGLAVSLGPTGATQTPDAATGYTMGHGNTKKTQDVLFTQDTKEIKRIIRDINELQDHRGHAGVKRHKENQIKLTNCIGHQPSKNHEGHWGIRTHMDGTTGDMDEHGNTTRTSQDRIR